MQKSLEEKKIYIYIKNIYSLYIYIFNVYIYVYVYICLNQFAVLLTLCKSPIPPLKKNKICKFYSFKHIINNNFFSWVNPSSLHIYVCIIMLIIQLTQLFLLLSQK